MENSVATSWTETTYDKILPPWLVTDIWASIFVSTGTWRVCKPSACWIPASRCPVSNSRCGFRRRRSAVRHPFNLQHTSTVLLSHANILPVIPKVEESYGTIKRYGEPPASGISLLSFELLQGSYLLLSLGNIFSAHYLKEDGESDRPVSRMNSLAIDMNEAVKAPGTSVRTSVCVQDVTISRVSHQCNVLSSSATTHDCSVYTSTPDLNAARFTCHAQW
jgi:hypothetical protein